MVRRYIYALGSDHLAAYAARIAQGHNSDTGSAQGLAQKKANRL